MCTNFKRPLKLLWKSDETDQNLVGDGKALVTPSFDFLYVTRRHGAGGWHDFGIAGR